MAGYEDGYSDVGLEESIGDDGLGLEKLTGDEGWLKLYQQLC